MKTESLNFNDLWPKVNEPLIYIGPDKPTFLTHGKEYQVKDISFISGGDLVHVIDDSGFHHSVELTKFSLLEK